MRPRWPRFLYLVFSLTVFFGRPAAVRRAAAPQGDPLLRMPQLREQIPHSPATIYRKIAEGKFPPGFKIGPNSRAWRQSTIDRHNAELEAADE